MITQFTLLDIEKIIPNVRCYTFTHHIPTLSKIFNDDTHHIYCSKTNQRNKLSNDTGNVLTLLGKYIVNSLTRIRGIEHFLIRDRQSQYKLYIHTNPFFLDSYMDDAIIKLLTDSAENFKYTLSQFRRNSRRYNVWNKIVWNNTDSIINFHFYQSILCNNALQFIDVVYVDNRLQFHDSDIRELDNNQPINIHYYIKRKFFKSIKRFVPLMSNISIINLYKNRINIKFPDQNLNDPIFLDTTVSIVKRAFRPFPFKRDNEIPL